MSDLFVDLRTEQALKLLDLLNEDRKDKEVYRPVAYYQYNDMFILVVVNSMKDHLFNVIDSFGNIPDGFCVNWRSINHIINELNLKQ